VPVTEEMVAAMSGNAAVYSVADIRID